MLIAILTTTAAILVGVFGFAGVEQLTDYLEYKTLLSTFWQISLSGFAIATYALVEIILLTLAARNLTEILL